MDQYSTPTTTADSNADGRMVVGVGSGKKCLKCAIKKSTCDGAGGCGKKKKHDGKGGDSLVSTSLGLPGYSKPATPPAMAMTSKPHVSGLASPSKSRSKTIRSLIKLGKSSAKKMSIGKLTSKRNPKIQSLKGVLKSLI